MSNQIVNFNLKKSKRQLAIATKHVCDAAASLEEIPEEYLPERLRRASAFLLDVASGFMEIYDDYATELISPR